MFQFPKEPRKIKRRISSYERKLRQEQPQHGSISDGYGERYLLGPLCLVLGDLSGAIGIRTPGRLSLTGVRGNGTHVCGGSGRLGVVGR